MEHLLVIAYGNPLRCDDGIAWQAAEELKRELPDSAEIIYVHQLTPELAENASRAHTVIFLDAARNGAAGHVSCQSVSPQPGNRVSRTTRRQAMSSRCARTCTQPIPEASCFLCTANLLTMDRRSLLPQFMLFQRRSQKSGRL
jgi:hypothetical protein